LISIPSSTISDWHVLSANLQCLLYQIDVALGRVKRVTIDNLVASG
jgi:hypothetical protein